MIKNKLYIEDIERVLRLNLNWEIFKGKNILITGATGLLGTILVDMFSFLEKEFSLGLKLFLVSRHLNKEKNATFITNICQDIKNPLTLSERFDFIIHAASNTHPLQYSRNPVETITTNIFGTYNLLQLCKNNPGSRFVCVSSVEIYGDGDADFSEENLGYIDCNSARAGYNESKRLSESLCQSFKSQYGVDFVTARLCRLYGPTLKKDDSKALSQFLFKGINGEDIVLKSDGQQFFSYLYGHDAAKAIIYLLLKGVSGEAYNVSDYKSNVTLKNLAEYITKICSVNLKFEIPPEEEKKGYSKSYRAILNSKKINQLGWSADFDIESGIKRTIEILKTSN